MRSKLFFSCFFFSSFFSKAQSTDGDSLFNVSAIHTINIYFTQPSFWDSLTTYYSLDQPMLGSVNIDGILVDSVGIQLKGNSSYNSMPGVKKSIKISFDEYVNRKFYGLKTVNLNNGFKDPSFLREKLMNDFLNEHNIPAPRCTYADVFINGTHWGFYTLVEQVNKTFLSDRFGNNDGNLYKGDPHGDLRWLGALPTPYYPNYELKTNTAINDWSDLVHLADMLNNTSSAQFHDSLESVMSTDFAIKSWASSNLFVNLDSYLGSGHNYYIYDDFLSQKFEWITWDVNEAFGNFNMGMGISQLENLNVTWLPSPADSRPLLNRMIQNSTYQNFYLGYLCQWIQNDFSLAVIGLKIDSLVNIIRPYVYADPNKQFTNANFELNVDHDFMNYPGIKDFITNRRASLTTQLIALGCSALQLEELKETGFKFQIFPNPFDQSATVEFDNPQHEDFDLMVYNPVGQLLLSIENIKSDHVKIERRNLADGIYFFRLQKEGELMATGKFILE